MGIGFLDSAAVRSNASATHAVRCAGTNRRQTGTRIGKKRTSGDRASWRDADRPAVWICYRIIESIRGREFDDSWHL
jgi:hypothetical protein